VPGARGFQQDFAVGPRGVCFEDEGKLRCAGGIPTPRGDDIAWAEVSQGQDASACSVRKGSVVCWGEAYARANAADTPVAIELEPMARPTEVAVVGSDHPEEWDQACRIRKGCTISVRPVPPCGPDVHPRDVSEVLATASSLEGQTLQVRGLLGVGPLMNTMKGCPGPGGRRCCNSSGGPVVLGGASKTISLNDFFCAGDESIACCNAPAYGQSIVAAGRLEHGDDMGARASGWKLAGATLCSEAGAP
jgi:hypothetical protein